MQSENNHRRWLERVTNWQEQVADIGLDGLLTALVQTARPLGPLAAQLLWVAQPTLNVFSTHVSDDAGSLASLLEDPLALDELLAHLTSPQTE